MPSFNDPITDYYRYELTPDVQRVSMPVPFVPDVLFILNVTDAPLYLHTGSTRIPTADNYDIVVLPNSYYSFIPYKNTQEFAALLDNPSAWKAIIYFRKGDAALQLAEVNYPFPDLNFTLNLTPMPDPAVSAAFTFVVL